MPLLHLHKHRLTIYLGIYLALSIIGYVVLTRTGPVAFVSLKLYWILAILPLPALVYVVFRKRKKTTYSLDNNRQTYQIGHANVDPTQRILSFHGEAAEIQPKLFDLLVYLIENRTRAMTKDELLEHVWPSVVVSDASLTQAIKRLRDIFRKNGFEIDVIRTLPRKGYQFDHAVQTPRSDSMHSRRKSDSPLYPTGVASITCALIILLIWNIEPNPVHRASNDGETLPTVAVLPFEDFTEDAAFKFFSEGLTDTITTSLTHTRNFSVIAPGSAKKAAKLSQNEAEIGTRLGVDFIVAGSVQKQGDTLRIVARLVDIETGEQTWSQVYNRKLDNVFSIHDFIADKIVSYGTGILTDSQALTSSIVEDKRQSAAYLYVLEGGKHAKSGKAKALKQAEVLYRKALEIAPDYPQALIGLANTLRILTTIGEVPREKGFAEAFSSASRAIEVNPLNSEAYIQLAEVQHRYFWNFELAEASYLKAIETGPSYTPAHVAYGRFLSKSGRYEEAMLQAAKSLELDPLSGGAATSYTIRLIRAGKLDTARSILDDFKLRYPDDPNIPWLETNWHIRNASYQDALQWITKEEYDYLRLSLSAIALHHLGRTGLAQKTLQELIDSDPDGAAFQIAEVYAHMEMPDEAFNWLQKAFEQGDPGLIELYSSVNMTNLYADKRFITLARQIGLPDISPQNLTP